MNIRIEVNLDNSAFEDNPGELARVLQQVKADPQTARVGFTGGSLKDSNGNTVGQWEVTE